MNTAAYLRLSREDGDKAESDSIANQRSFVGRFIAGCDGLSPPEYYIDDGFTGTNFQRPAFERMIADIESGRINCIVVKDLSRFGRDYIETGRYLERWLPEHAVRFIAINDAIDSGKAAYDMLLPMKNVFNTQYAKDISQKVKSSIKAKQQRGDFIGAFPCYGYSKDPANHNHLIIDVPAAQTVKRIFELFEAGTGKLGIAKKLNADGIPCPSEYKKLCGEKYCNGQKLDETKYWTYATVNRILKNQIYAGNMEQGRSYRVTMHGKAKTLEPRDWVVVENTHEPIISACQWQRVQALLKQNTRSIDFEQNISPFAGYLKCGDCGRAMSKTKSAGGIYYCCGSYKRYGPSVCSKHSISHRVLEDVVLEDLNSIIAAVPNLRELALKAMTGNKKYTVSASGAEKLKTSLERLMRLKKCVYEDYRDGLLSFEEYSRYKADYESQCAAIDRQLAAVSADGTGCETISPWVESLLNSGRITQLDRVTAAEVLDKIKIYETGLIEISYRFSPEAGMLIDE